MPKIHLYKKTQQSGFTLIEILIAVAIMVLLSALTIAAFSTLNKQVSLDTTSQNILSVLRRARSQTLASENESTYGVHFETSKYVLFKGTSYTNGAAYNKEFNLSETEIYAVTLAGGVSDVVFDRIRGTTSQSGTVSTRLSLDTSKTNTVSIDPSGQVSLSNTLTTTGSRLSDSRHLHYDLGWSIQNSTTLTLTWTDAPNPTVTQNIAMIGFFNVGKSSFDWSGTITVNSVDQVLRIHTHSLDATSTILSISRDVRYNTKALSVSIDGKNIVSYTAAGVATVGAYGGTMSVQ